MFASKDLAFSRPSGYQISRSVRLRSSASAYFNRTFGTPTSGNIFTWSSWVKRGAISAVQPLFSPSLVAGEGAAFNSTNQLAISVNGAVLLVSTAVYRDPSAWYHIVLVSDMGNATATLRFRVYVNGVEVTSWATDARATYTSFPYWNKNAVVHYIGYSNAYSAYADGYITETNFIDGQALTPSSFGQYNANGVWSPIKYAGTYGTNGFYLNFSDNSGVTATTIGKDNSGNGNNWTPNNISVTAGVTYDSMLDSPTPYADGGNGRGNYAVLNPLENVNTTYMAFQNGNLRANMGTGAVTGCWSSMVFPSGKFYFEATITTVSNGTIVGISYGSNTYADGSSKCIGYTFNGDKSVLGTSTAYGATYTTGDVIGVAVDTAAGTVTFYKNNASQGVITDASILAQSYRAWLQNGTSGQSSLLDINFGQRPFTYTPPTGFVALNTQNLPAPTIANGAAYMAATTYTGTGASLTIANTVNSTSFQPDWVWVKGRSGATDHALYDSVRGTTKDLASNTTAAETTQATGLTAFGSTGFTVGALAKMNTSAATYVAWQWNTNGGSSASNTSGTITSTVSAGATQGFSVVTYTGVGGLSTVGHGLGVAPRMIILMPRSFVSDKYVYHASIGAANFVSINLTSASAATALWNSTSPTSTVFTVNGNGANQSTSTFVAYCFSEVAGYSKFGSYTGNGSADGPFVYLGFKPKFVMIKQSDGVTNWSIKDSSVNTYNAAVLRLYPNTSGAETSGADLDYLSNGFKCRTTSNEVNAAGTYIYMAFAENPFKYSLAR